MAKIELNVQRRVIAQGSWGACEFVMADAAQVPGCGVDWASKQRMVDLADETALAEEAAEPRGLQSFPRGAQRKELRHESLCSQPGVQIADQQRGAALAHVLRNRGLRPALLGLPPQPPA